MPTTATRVVVNCATGEQITETYEIPDLTPEELAAQEAAAKQRLLDELTNAVQSHLDTVAKEHGYDNIMSACSYASAPNAFQDEGIKFLAWRANCWTTCHSIMTDVESGAIPVPSTAELVAAMPEL